MKDGQHRIVARAFSSPVTCRLIPVACSGQKAKESGSGFLDASSVRELDDHQVLGKRQRALPGFAALGL
ncbi:MAG TPA: hypothetical protein VLA94_03910, partial [Syntrophales bacterium]|nr:hypothetical protein [Syntrophales bacterium]